ncbi:39S ribosomal protein L17, mitochondrial [Triplophysa tibetana]|uniref:Large ribosomal subunit protein bL17m n=1 Tax=Triplophysa tibetana TaxID=1572043 RepID=A0A5A9N1U7_9TELE|nr:39S ribosomal protein L17, mitochondrial [Triplophysa tibetana]
MRLTLRAFISHGRVARRMGLGPESRINILRNILTGLVRHERIETTKARADEFLNFSLLLKQFKHTIRKNATLSLTSFTSPIQEKDLIPKLFKVLAPRFENQTSYTCMARIPNRENLDRAHMAVLEYKGNPFPPLYPVKRVSELNILNQLLKGYREEKDQMLLKKKDL